MSDKVGIALVDDHPLLREGVAGILAAQTDFEIVAQGDSADAAYRIAHEFSPDVMILDVSMPGNGLKAAQSILGEFPAIIVIMLTVSEAEEDIVAAFKAGAKGYVLKGVGGSELVRIVRAVLSGDPYVTPSLAAGLLGEWQDRSVKKTVETDKLSDLTRREREILELVAVGQSNKEVARNLSISEKTVKHNMTNILQKLQVRNRVEAALLARGSRVGQ